MSGVLTTDSPVGGVFDVNVNGQGPLRVTINAGGAGPTGPAGPAGPTGPAGPAGVGQLIAACVVEGSSFDQNFNVTFIGPSPGGFDFEIGGVHDAQHCYGIASPKSQANDSVGLAIFQFAPGVVRFSLDESDTGDTYTVIIFEVS